MAVLATRFQVRAESAPSPGLASPEGFPVTFGDNEGDVDLSWDNQREALNQEAQRSDGSDAGPWSQAGMTRPSKLGLTGLKSGTKYWFRVRAHGRQGAGPWSDAVAKRVP